MQVRVTIPPPTCGKPGRARTLALLGTSVVALLLAEGARAEGPRGGIVTRGAADIARSESRTTIHQTSRRAIIDWRRFDIGRDHRVDFDQPGRDSATLNRVVTARPSVIEGALSAPGTVIIQNGAGILFTGTARIDTGSLVATSQDVDARRFETDGALSIGGGDRAGARVVNQGEITIGEAGLAALVGRDVENAGAIVADRGTVTLAGGLRSTIDLTGDGMLRIAVDGDAGRVVNSGRIDASGGRVILTAGQAARTLDAAINTSGVIRASSGSDRGGSIELVGRGGGKVRVSGTLEANAAGTGGTIAVTGKSVAIETGARISAQGATDGGTVRIGGGRQGQGPLRRAATVALATGSTVAADGVRGRGGSVVVWSDGLTRVDGTISATGGARGGFVETSSRGALSLDAAAAVSAGTGGFWLLDPRDVIIGNVGSAPSGSGTVAPPPGPGYYRISHLALQNALDAGSDVTVTTTQPASTGQGDIIVERPVAWTGPGSLRLEADRDISIEAAISGGTGGIIAAAGRNLAVGADVTGTGSAEVALTARTGDLWIGRPSAGDIAVTTEFGDLSLTAPLGQVAIRRTFTHGTGTQIDSLAGALAVTAGTGVLIEGGATEGQWVRVGTETGAGAITIEAPRIDVLAGTGGFAEIVTGAGGALSLRAEDLILRNSPGHADARIAARGGAALTIEADRQTWDGAVESGTGLSDGGDVHLSGAIAASVQPRFSLAEGADFVLAAATPNAAASSYTSALPFAVSTAGSGSISLGGPITAERITVLSQERVRLEAAARLTGTGTGNAVVVAAGRHFETAAGPDAVSAANGRWLVYIDRFDGAEGVLPAAGDYDLYGRSFATTPPPVLGFAGNRLVWGERPVLTLTADTLHKTYGQAATPGFAASGLRPGDSLATALASGPNIFSPGAPATAPARTYTTRVVATASSQGYVLKLANGTLAVDPASLTVTALDASRTYGAAAPVYGARYTGFVLGEDVGDLGGDLRVSTTAAPSSPVGAYALTPGGLSSGNYAITYVPGTLTVAPAPLTITALDAARRVGGPDPDYSARYEGFVLGEGPAALDGTLWFSSNASAESPPGSYRLTPGGLGSGNYAITYAPGVLTIQPALPVAPDTGPAQSSGVYAFRRGVPPLTPGDASFRTTIAEAPPALANPFDLTYSLGEIVELAPVAAAGSADTQGFVPAAGGLAPRRTDGTCRGAVGRGEDGCGRRRIRENYWGTATEADQ